MVAGAISFVKAFLLSVAALVGLVHSPLRGGGAESLAIAGDAYQSATRFIFFSVLEGLYEDGVANEDVERILLRKSERQSYFHFIYSCPVCDPAVWALEAYRSRPERFAGSKLPTSTFGRGLSETLHESLRSDDPRRRLGAINELMRTWMERRLRGMSLTEKERAELTDTLEKLRQRGMHALEVFRQNGTVANYAPAYEDLDECAVCNGAVGKPMKLPNAR